MESSRNLADYHYHLPKERIALYPAKRRDESRLLVLNRHTGEITHNVFSDLPEFLNPGDALVINDTRVIPARLIEETKNTAKIEFLIAELSADGTAKGLIRKLRKLKEGRIIDFGAGLSAEFLKRDGDFGVVRFNIGGADLDGWLARYGHVPLPPYIKRPDEPEDRQRYQTVYAKRSGSCAAPTAGLHFTPELLERLRDSEIFIATVCLHVGPGTFKPITAEDVTEHSLEAEFAEVTDHVYSLLLDVKKRGRRVVAVGTTATRAIESAATAGGGFCAKTDLYISPGFKYQMTDALITNFHLPRSSLLVLVCAFAGREKVLAAYKEAVRLKYRFYSYGDAMLIV